MTDDELNAAHKHCTGNRSEIERSKFCGCFYCCGRFASAYVQRWLPMEDTAFCPLCQIDSVIGDASGFPVEDPKFLQLMHEYWFKRTVSAEEVEAVFGARPNES